MNSGGWVCLDTSVIIKVLVPEEDYDKATALFQEIIENERIIILPAVAWTEVGSVLRKKCKKGELTPEEAEALWVEFRQFPGIEYLDDESVMDRAWKISRHFNMTTLYDAAFLSVAEVVTEKTGEACVYWTADEKVVNTLGGQRDYVKFLKTN